MTSIDLNADLGESFGTWSKGHDSEILNIVSSANIACGFHAGDALIMENTCQACLDNDVGIGAHPGFQDLAGFGRREIRGYGSDILRAEAIYQIGALATIAAVVGAKIRHVKFHGALANMASRDLELAKLLVGTVQSIDDELIFMAISGTMQQLAAEEMNASFVSEIFADRAYNDDGTLVSRNEKGAIIREPMQCAENILRAVETGELKSINGNPVPVKPETVCMHGDTPEAIDIAFAVRNLLEKTGVRVERF